LNELAAKQEAFEEANRLKNQFRALDQDEIEFLDSVLESTRKEEERVKRETAEGLALFRKQQDEADKKARRGSEGAAIEEGSLTLEEESWVAGGRKRKRVKDKEGLKGVKVRRLSTSTETARPDQAGPPTSFSPENPASKGTGTAKQPVQLQKSSELQSLKPESPVVDKKQPALAQRGLVDYGSDDDDDG
jgi:FAM192A/Fyv6, N-terminal domain